MMIFRTAIIIIVLLLAIVMYALCMVAHTSDEDAERMYQEYLEYKRRKERDDGS